MSNTRNIRKIIRVILQEIDDTNNIVDKIFYHGTTKKNKENILQNGFITNYYMQQGLYGEGVYFYDNLKDVQIYNKGGIIEVNLKTNKNILLVYDDVDLVEKISKIDPDSQLYFERNGLTYEFGENYVQPFIENKKINAIYLKDSNILVVYNTNIINILN